MKRLNVVVAGGANIDLLGKTAGAALPGDSAPGTVTFRCGGVGRNICENLARLGAQTELISAVGDDWAADLLLSGCKDAGIGVSCFYRTSGRTGVYLAMEDETGELLAAVNDMDVLKELTPDALSDCESLLHSADALVLDANLPEESLIWFAEHCPAPIFADPVSCIKAPRLIPILPRLCFLKPNRAELRLLTGREDILEGMESLRARGVRNVCVSLGAQGAYLMTENGRQYHVPAPRIGIQSVTGAGDSLTAACAFALLSGKEPLEALRFGVAAASLTLRYEGAVRPDLSVSLIEKAVKELLI